MAGYCECLVPKKVDSKSKMIHNLLLVLAVLTAIIGFFFNFLSLGLTIISVIAYIIYGRLINVEYEYVIVGGEMRIVKVVNKNKRKDMGSFVLEHVERIMVTSEDPDVDTSRWANKVLDYSSGAENENQVRLLTKKDSEFVLMVLTASDKLVNALKQEAPRKAWQKFLW